MKKIFSVLIIFFVIVTLLFLQAQSSYAKKNPCDKGKTKEHNKHCSTPTPVPTVFNLCSGPNLLINGDIEQGLTNWTVEVDPNTAGNVAVESLSNRVWEGNFSLLLNINTTYNYPDRDYYSVISTNRIYIKPDHHYQLTGKVFIDDSSSIEYDSVALNPAIFWYKNYANSPDGVLGLNPSAQWLPATNKQWLDVNIYSTAPPDAEFSRISLTYLRRGGNNHTKIWYDDLKFIDCH